MLTYLRKSSSVSSFSIACFRSYIAYSVSFIFHLNVFLVSVSSKGFAYLLCWPRRNETVTRRFSFHEFYNFLLFNFLILIFFGKPFLPTPTPTTHTHDPRPLPTTHDRRHLATLHTIIHTHKSDSPTRIPPVVGYHPAIRSISSIFQKHIYFLSSSQLCATLFKSIPLVAFLRTNQPEIR